MIRFCKGKIMPLYIEKWTKETLLLMISEQNLKHLVFTIHEDGRERGDVLYEDILYCRDLHELRPNRKVSFDKNVFENVKTFMTPGGGTNYTYYFCPVYGRDGKFLYCAFDDGTDPANMSWYINVLSVSAQREHCTLADFYPEIEYYCFYGVNEIQYVLHQYLESRGIAYRLLGEEWRILDESVLQREHERCVLEQNMGSVTLLYGDIPDDSMEIQDEAFLSEMKLFLINIHSCTDGVQELCRRNEMYS